MFLLLGFLSRLMTPQYIQMGEVKPYDQHFKLPGCLLPFIGGTEYTLFSHRAIPFHYKQALFRKDKIIKIKLVLIFLYIANTTIHPLSPWAKGEKQHTPHKTLRLTWRMMVCKSISADPLKQERKTLHILNCLDFSKYWKKARREWRSYVWRKVGFNINFK